MTIAGCFVTGEGVVLGADSTTSFGGLSDLRCFDHAQKLLQIDEEGCFGIVTWGTGDIGEFTYRTNVARFSDALKAPQAKTTEEAAQRWSDFFWDALNKHFDTELKEGRQLQAKKSAGGTLKPEEEQKLLDLASARFGFCVGGRGLPERQPSAYVIEVMDIVNLTSAPKPTPVPRGTPMFWGAPRLFERMMFSYDEAVVDDILSVKTDPADPTSPNRWNGSRQELVNIFLKHQLRVQPQMPIRDVIDFVHSAISMTCKWIRFAQLPPVCGGAVEVAVITSDRAFRWVRHKPFDVAI